MSAFDDLELYLQGAVLSGAVSDRAGRHIRERLAGLKTAGLDDAITFFTDKQKDLDRQRTAAKSLSNAEIADMKTEAGRCGWAAQKLRDLRGRRKKGAKG